MRDVVYSSILDGLTLSPADVVQLLGRGLDEETISRNRYATCASRERMTELATAAAKRYDVAGVPGFRHLQDSRWTVIAEEGDMLIPVRDAQWRIIAIRRRSGSRENRYRWMSWQQAPSGAPPHHAEPWHLEFRPALVVTEGELKADAIACITCITTVGLAGAGSIPAGFPSTLRDAYPALRSVFIAFDADASQNQQVRSGRNRLRESLLSAGYRAHLLEWDIAGGKGLDDVLARALA